MKKAIFLMMILLHSLSASAQICVHKNLSGKYTFINSVERIKAGFADSCLVIVKISGKKDMRPFQAIHFSSTWLFSSVFKDCSAVRSYSTHINEKDSVIDNDYGDLVVADFNFDGREDFAVKNNSGGNAGPTYLFYLQQKNGKFTLDKFLSHKMEFFPDEINTTKQTLTTLVHANAMNLSKMIYKLDKKTNSWKRRSHTFVPY